ncbi:putative inactive carboxylesterase 4 [Asterias rubens]|uniref:putative inactive carboxylesterase 4 n=1 Tax=Asterias rubens TaxID=7604 RepID=UPI001455147B|nr:putative inactive carboxylesterase 4 [Asterias rubens]
MHGIVVQIVVVILMTVLQFEVASTSEDAPIIDTAAGKVVGSRAKVPLTTSTNYTSFLGIPYAEPPLGALRFAKPIPKKPWEGVRDALTYGAECPQKTSNSSETTDEDCLFLNIFVPVDSVTESRRLPVMVWFHGGSFTSGSGSTYNGMKLATHGEVVVVNLNYRLGLLGFLCTGDEASPGNYGFWDQRLAVQWVKTNIWNFGGDPEQITIFGESAGGMSVSFHALSPVNDRSLFQRVIAGSGAADDSLLMASETCRATAGAIGGAVGCDNTTDSTRSLIDCLRKVPQQTFITLQSQPSVIGHTPIGPTLDGEFITDRISNLIQSPNIAQYDLLTGVNSDDGSYFGIDPDGVDGQLFTSQTTAFLDDGYPKKLDGNGGRLRLLRPDHQQLTPSL